EPELVVGLVVGGHDLDHDGGGREPGRLRQALVVATVRHPVVVRFAEVERIGAEQAGGVGEWCKEHGELSADVAVSGVSGRCHVVGALPHLVERVDAERPTALNQSLELPGGGPQYDRLHVPSVATAPTAGAGVARPG